MDERETWRLSAWLLGGVLAFAAVRIAFSYTGVGTANIALRRLGISGIALGYSRGPIAAIVVVGVLLAGLLSFVCVRRAGAPRQLWLSAVVVSVMHASSLGFSVATVALMDAEMVTASEVAAKLLSSVPFVTPQAYALAAVGYPLVAWIGCSLALRRSSEAVSEGAVTHA